MDIKRLQSITRSQKIYDILLNHEDFKHEYKISRRRFLKTIKESVNKDGSRHLSQWNRKVLQEETSRLMNVFASLPASWEASISDYIKTGILTPPMSSTMPKVRVEVVEPSQQSKLTVQVYKHTTRKQYIEAWKTVEQLQKYMWELEPKFLSKKDLRIIKKYKQGKTDVQILQDISDDITPSAIRKIISRKAPQLGVTSKKKKP